MEVYRIVNGADVVARLPRHGNAVGNLLDYEHCGPTVLVGCGDGGNAALGAGPGVEGGPAAAAAVDEAVAAAAAEAGGVWVEGETDGQPCPLRDTSPLVDPLADGAILFEALRSGRAEKWGLGAAASL